MQKRNNYINLIIGRRGCGKTTFFKKILNIEKKKKLVVDTILHPSYEDFQSINISDIKRFKSGKARVICNNFDLLFYEINNNIINAHILFEDCTKYIDTNIPQALKAFMVDSKQKNLDLTFMYHGFGFVQPAMFRLADTITVFKTNENIKRYESKIPNYPAIEKAYNIVNESKNPFLNKTLFIN